MAFFIACSKGVSLTESGQLKGVGSVDHVHVCLKLEFACTDIKIMIENRKLECRLHLIRPLFKYGT